MTRILSQASGLFSFDDFVYQVRWLIHVFISTAVTMFFLLSNSSQILGVAFLLPVSIVPQCAHICKSGPLYIGTSYHSREFNVVHVNMSFTAIRENKFSRKFSNLQYTPNANLC